MASYSLELDLQDPWFRPFTVRAELDRAHHGGGGAAAQGQSRMIDQMRNNMDDFKRELASLRLDEEPTRSRHGAWVVIVLLMLMAAAGTIF
jgi:hypothetical protein